MHRRRLAPLMLLAGLAIVAAGSDGLGSPRPSAPRSTATASPTVTPHRPAAPARAAPRGDDGAVRVARAYALAARNWTARSYRAAWRRELALATPAYRRALRAAAPTTAELRALRADRAASHATVQRTRRDPALRPPRARVLVWLAERTDAAGASLSARTRSEVRLAQRHGRWRVTGWSLLPGSTR